MVSSTAARMCRLSKLVYSTQDVVDQQLLSLGYTHFKWFNDCGVYAFIAYSCINKELVICFRGVKIHCYNTVLTYLKIWTKKVGKQGRIHYGFAKACDLVYTKMISYIGSLAISKTAKIVCTGHSLGGAIATIFASRMAADELYTFGSPRVGNKTFRNSIDTKHYRFVHNNDIITIVPFTFMGYYHHGTLFYISSNGNITSTPFSSRLYDELKGRYAAFKQGRLFDWKHSHSINLYYKKITKNVCTQS